MDEFLSDNRYDKMTEITPIQKALDSFLHEIDPTGEHTQVQTSLNRAWADITGPSTVEHTISLFRRGKMIIVWVDNAAWANNIRMLESMYVEKLKEALNDSSISTVRVEVKRRKKLS